LRLENPAVVKFAVVLFRESLAEDEFTFDEMRDRLYDQLADENGVRHYLEILKRNTYVHIRS
jgi:hypothetical protein